MADSNWRRELDLLIEANLNELLKETKEYNYAISQAKDKSKAQMWVGMAIINSKLNRILLKDKKYEKKLSKDELDKILNTLEKL